MRPLTQELLQELFDYRDDGTFTWKASPCRRIPAGAVAGTTEPNSRGYMRVKIEGKEYTTHRLVYLYHHGELPEIVDHINRIKDDNKIENLRGATRCQNAWNVEGSPDAKVSSKGITYRRGKPKPWVAELRHNGRRVLHLSCKTRAEAEQAVKEMRRIMHGEFAVH